MRDNPENCVASHLHTASCCLGKHQQRNGNTTEQVITQWVESSLESSCFVLLLGIYCPRMQMHHFKFIFSCLVRLTIALSFYLLICFWYLFFCGGPFSFPGYTRSETLFSFIWVKSKILEAYIFCCLY
jgi:hypothetical protein